MLRRPPATRRVCSTCARVCCGFAYQDGASACQPAFISKTHFNLGFAWSYHRQKQRIIYVSPAFPGHCEHLEPFHSECCGECIDTYDVLEPPPSPRGSPCVPHPAPHPRLTCIKINRVLTRLRSSPDIGEECQHCEWNNACISLSPTEAWFESVEIFLYYTDRQNVSKPRNVRLR